MFQIYNIIFTLKPSPPSLGNPKPPIRPYKNTMTRIMSVSRYLYQWLRHSLLKRWGRLKNITKSSISTSIVLRMRRSITPTILIIISRANFSSSALRTSMIIIELSLRCIGSPTPTTKTRGLPWKSAKRPARKYPFAKFRKSVPSRNKTKPITSVLRRKPSPQSTNTPKNRKVNTDHSTHQIRHNS